ncbi:hypothetical protein G114_00745 [Aeromonas diversa CDC 2478-85]|uniref:tRNA(Met) cytidine acetyltransferase TmcA n=1 Tax=Aeromonas diversa CDC 2478-85 TaxID=1268237 RepID=N9VF82_9GAMM|nr:GNAT family N-acetyltransferase [Aeromonas diversa]ENY73927.1 hypothetical protein G114_00745 [Aeromonas diversa CDC 2478-85]
MTLREGLRQAGERRLIWLEGEEQECIAKTREWLDGHIVWLGEGPAEHSPLPAAKALRYLGRECDTLVCNAFSGFHPDAFGALSGTLRAGGLLLLLTPPRARWPIYADPDRLRLIADPVDLPRCGQGFIERMVRLLSQDPALALELPEGVPSWQPLGLERPRTADQEAAIQAIGQVLRGHRKRPLVLSADRGRGKSSALGMAAAALLTEEPGLRIGITAPAQATLSTLLLHAGEDKRLLFFSPDRLLEERPALDLLLVDEAAAIPTPLLEGLLAHYHRMVFATTEHGYEGTGRGFHLRFKRTLDRRTPGWRELHMQAPIRWSDNDPLEPLVNRLLALSAEPPTPLLTAPPRWEPVSAASLTHDEDRLSALFGLLVLAHYQTSPSDLRALLECPDLDIHQLCSGGSLLGVALVMREGPIPSALAEEIWAGRRRPRGQLLPQSLLAHSGVRPAADRRFARVMRIAIHPSLHRKGLGAQLLTALEDHYRAQQFDYLGSAFSAGVELLPFWLNRRLRVVRIGLQRDAASGCHSLLMLKALTPALEPELDEWQRRFLLGLPSLLAGELRTVSAELLAQCLPGSPLTPLPGLESWEWEELACFAHHHKPFELCQGTLQRWLLTRHAELAQWSQQEQRLMVGAIWQYKSWESLARELGLSGRGAVITQLREQIGSRIDHNQL